ncbi:hypothetical protein CBS101457_002046 [Exobasidium rhododendri]|nr:hypothetical protein CBS101457_002046 [Exobasidium rhododendri]
MPQLKPTVKKELPDSSETISKAPSAPIQIRRDAERKIADTREEMKEARQSGEAQASLCAVKKQKAMGVYERAMRRADDELEASRRRYDETLKRLEERLTQESQALKWIRDTIAEKTEVIEVSSDSSDDDNEPPQRSV